jgi:nucleoid-associated protein YgaU
MMTKNGKVVASVLMAVLVVMSFAGCAKPPTSEMADATKAFEDAKVARADQYAPEQFGTAEAALNEANTLMEQKKYKQAREKALQAMKLARDAHVASIENQNAANRKAQEMYDMALNAINAANQANAYGIKEAAPTMIEAQKHLEEAQRLYLAQDFIASEQESGKAMALAQEAKALAEQFMSSRQAEEGALAVQEMRDPGAMPRPYPTNHVVIKGESLWWIAEYKQIYNDPFQWPLIYKANRSKIKDPDLIFPGQDFVITRQPELTDDMIKEAIRFAKRRGAWSLHDGK